MHRQSGRGSQRTLREATVGVPLVVTGPVEAAPSARRRLAELGVREGAHIVIQGRTAGGGAILAVGDGRIAVSGRLLTAIPTAPQATAEATSDGSARADS